MNRALMFGGAFNPPTIAHLETARFAAQAEGCGRVIFVPSKSTYIRDEQRKDFAYTDAQRLHMLQRTAEGRDWMTVCDHEQRQKEQPRTYATLRYLKEQGWQCRLLFGSDKLPELQTVWRHVEEIAEEFGFVVMTRAEDDCEAMILSDAYLRKLRPYMLLVETPEKYRHISSTGVRKLLAQGTADREQLASLLPEELMGLQSDPSGEEFR